MPSTSLKKRNGKSAEALVREYPKEELDKGELEKEREDSTLSECTPFIEHKLSKTLRRVVKYSFRSFTILAVLLFSSVTLSSISILLHLLYCWFYHLDFKLTFIEYWLLLEALFLLTMNFKYRVFLAMSSHHLPKVDRPVFEKIKQEFQNIEDMSQWIQGWFFHRHWSLITFDDLLEWTAGQFFNSTPDKLDTCQLEMSLELCDVISMKLPTPMPRREKNPPLKKILLTLDSPEIYHRPLLYYIFVRAIDVACRTILTHFMGFKRMINGALPFYLRSGNSEEPPIVFFHGLGIGLTSYLPFIAALAVQHQHRNIVLFEMPSIQMKLDENHVLPSEFALHVNCCLLQLGFKRNIFIGHSLGTACVRWMDLYYPDLVIGRIFIDPIVFSLWTHHIAYNAIYREPTTFHEAFLKYIGMSEPGHATFLHRYFCWFQNTYLSENLPENSFIFMSEMDNIVDTPVVANYLVKHACKSRQIIIIKAFRHGQILASPEVSRIVMAIENLSLK